MKQATPQDLLEDQIMNPCISKTEAEHWACREIERLRRRLEIDPRWPNYDGIATRDETITMLQSVIARLEKQLLERYPAVPDINVRIP